MLNPLDAFKRSFLKDIEILGKTFTFDTSKPLKTLNKVGILVDTLKAVNKLNLDDFGSIKEALDKGVSIEDAKRAEIESWEPEIVELLVAKFIQLLKSQKPTDFKNHPDLRIYWKIRKMFGKEEVDGWSDIDYQWAVYNITEDLKEQDEFDDRTLEKRKIWYNTDLYKHLNKKEEERKRQEQEDKLLIQKIMEQQGVNPNNFEIELVEEEDIPTVIEEEQDG